MNRREKIEVDCAEMAKALIDQGRLVEAGWIGLKRAAYPDGVGDEQGEQLRGAFFAGAQHLMGSIIGALDPDAEPTEQDMVRMEMIAGELEAWIHEFKARHGITDPDIGSIETTGH